jgi:hypothetical protein
MTSSDTSGGHACDRSTNDPEGLGGTSSRPDMGGLGGTGDPGGAGDLGGDGGARMLSL